MRLRKIGGSDLRLLQRRERYRAWHSMENIVLVDYGSGNVHSAKRALTTASNNLNTEVRIVVSADPEVVRTADRIVLPGVGHIASCRKQLENHVGLIAAMAYAGINRAIPFLGICVGMQLLATKAYEDCLTEGLNWINGSVTRIKPSGNLRVPHMGWNNLTITDHHPVLSNLDENPHVYFVHSYAYKNTKTGDVIAVTDYGGTIIAAVAKKNFVGTQFHPEKSQSTGLKILENFIRWTPS